MSYLLDAKDADVVIIPEQHLWNKAITSVPSMLQDNDEIINELCKIIDSLDNPVVIFDGDIWHRGVPNTEESLKMMGYPLALYEKTGGKVFSVVGNHEITYKKNNIFWGISSIESPYIQSTIRTKYIVENPLIKIVDELCIGDLCVIFGHYGRTFITDSLDVPEDIKHAVYITHNSFGDSEIFKLLNSKGQGIQESFMNVQDISVPGVLPPIKCLENVYVGHMHKAHGVFQVNGKYGDQDCDFKLRYLASLGRTSHSEYTDDVVREIPILHIRDGKYTGETLETITLKEREVAVDEEIVAINKEKYDRDVEIRQLRAVKVYNNDLVTSIKEVLSLNTNCLQIVEYADKNEIPDFIKEAIQGGI